jgi:hypothetical protein
MSDVPVIISIFALVISAWSLIISRNLTRARLKEMQTAVLTARLNVRIINDKGGRSFSLKIENSGKALARNIEILIEGKSALEHPPLCWGAAPYGGFREGGIISQLDAGTNIEYPLMYGCGNPARMDIELRWSDDSGIQRSFKALLLPIETR